MVSRRCGRCGRKDIDRRQECAHGKSSLCPTLRPASTQVADDGTCIVSVGTLRSTLRYDHKRSDEQKVGEVGWCFAPRVCRAVDTVSPDEKTSNYAGPNVQGPVGVTGSRRDTRRIHSFISDFTKSSHTYTRTSSDVNSQIDGRFACVSFIGVYMSFIGIDWGQQTRKTSQARYTYTFSLSLFLSHLFFSPFPFNTAIIDVIVLTVIKLIE